MTDNVSNKSLKNAVAHLVLVSGIALAGLSAVGCDERVDEALPAFTAADIKSVPGGVWDKSEARMGKRLNHNETFLTDAVA